MNKTAVCTISTQSHIFKSKALLLSVCQYFNTDLYCLITDGGELPESICGESYHHLDILSDSLSIDIKKKYTGNKLRWSCKPLYLIYLLNEGYDKVIYVDNDIYFFSPADFLFDELEGASVLLTPHYYSTNTNENQNWLEANYRVGLYNAGFVGATQKGLSALKWWASCCLYNVKQSSWRGLFDDQKYLDLLPVIYDDVKVLKHKGCNVAGWNIEMCPRTEVSGEVLVDVKWPVVFIHFTPLTFNNILTKVDGKLTSHLETYISTLKTHFPHFSIASELKNNFKDYLLYFRHLRWRITRFFE